jgi:hypothetical protein
LARQYGIEIPSDVRIISAKLGDMPRGAPAFYLNLERASGNIAWEDLLGAEGKLLVRVKSSRFLSDEALVSVIGHEMHEVNALRTLFQEAGGSLSARDLHLFIDPMAKHPSGLLGGSLHREALEVESQLRRLVTGG